MKRILLCSLCLAMLLSISAGCVAVETATQTQDGAMRSFTDDVGRSVQIPAQITRTAPAGSVAAMLLTALAPETLVTVGADITDEQAAFLPARLASLPVTGQIYGGKSALNLETLLSAEPQILIDMGDKKSGLADDLDALQEQLGIPVIFLEADLAHMAQAFRTLGAILTEKTERAETLAAFVDRTLQMARENAGGLTEEQKKSVLYTSGPAGLDVNAAGSSQAQVIELVGAVNAADFGQFNSKSGGTSVNFEQLYSIDPDVIVFAPGSVFKTAAQDEAWMQLRAIRDGQFCEAPGLPYNWLSNPPSLNMLLGVWWLGNLLYPEVYDYDMAQVTREFYSLFWGVELTDAQINSFLNR